MEISSSGPSAKWTAEVAILAPRRELALEDCREARVLPWDYELARRLKAYSRLPFVANVSFEREYVADWLAANMQKIQFLSSAVAPYRAVYFTDWDVDPAPYRMSIAQAASQFSRQLHLFLEDEATLIIGSPDGSAPINGGVFLVKPSAAAGGGAYGIAVQWLRNGSDAIWDPELGYDRVGQPSTLGLPRGASVRGPSYVTTRTSHRNFTHSYCNTHSAHVCARL